MNYLLFFYYSKREKKKTIDWLWVVPALGKPSRGQGVGKWDVCEVKKRKIFCHSGLACSPKYEVFGEDSESILNN
jgi:hypothetical protein